jgi:hypothetical protein
LSDFSKRRSRHLRGIFLAHSVAEILELFYDTQSFCALGWNIAAIRIRPLPDQATRLD